MAKSLVTCKNCGIEFLKRNYNIAKYKNHYCSNKCVSIFKSKESISKSIGNKYSKLTILSFSHYKNGYAFVNFSCDCGELCIKRLDSVKNGHTKTCGDCLSVEERFMSHVNVIDPTTWLWLGYKTKDGYGKFYYKGESRSAHRVAYELFIGPIPDGMWCLHRDDDPSNCCPYNIFLGTHQDNMDDMIKKNRQAIPSGEKHGNSVLKSEEVAEIRRLYKTGEYIYKDLALRFNSCISTIGAIIRNETWKE